MKLIKVKLEDLVIYLEVDMSDVWFDLDKVDLTRTSIKDRNNMQDTFCECVFIDVTPIEGMVIFKAYYDKAFGIIRF